MYAGAQRHWNSKRRIILTQCRLRQQGQAPVAGPEPLKDRFALSRPGEFNLNHERIVNMLYTIAVVLIILWLLGMVTSVTMGGLVHVLLVIAIIVVLLRVISGRSPL